MLSFLVLSEDGSESAVPTLTALMKRAWCAMMPELHRVINRNDLLRFEFPEARLRRALTGNKWKSRSPADRQDVVALTRTIASHLRRPNAFVHFHFDGDTTYSDRQRSITSGQFTERVVHQVKEMLRGSLERDAKGGDLSILVEKHLARLMTVIPFYCIESWTYYNTRELRNFCDVRDHATIASWEANPGATEEFENPSSSVSAGKSCNRKLAERNYPAAVSLAAGKSFADTINMMFANDQLTNALRAIANLHGP